MNNHDAIPIIFCINSKFRGQLETVIVSILEHSEEKFEFIILTCDLTNIDECSILKTIQSKSQVSTLSIIHINEYIPQNIHSLMSIRENYNYISIETYFRFFIPTLLTKYDKVLYLDSDILVCDNIKKLYDEDISNYYGAAIIDKYVMALCENDALTGSRANLTFNQYLRSILNIDPARYFNAGVMLLNLKEIRKNNITSSLWNYAIDHSPLEFQDQDVLNAVLHRKIKLINQRWNQTDNNSKIGVEIKYENRGIIHFTGAEKPWNTKDISYRFLIHWWATFKKTNSWESKYDPKIDLITKIYSEYPDKVFFDNKILRVYRRNFRFIVAIFGKKIFRKRIFNKYLSNEVL